MRPESDLYWSMRILARVDGSVVVELQYTGGPLRANGACPTARNCRFCAR